MEAQRSIPRSMRFAIATLVFVVGIALVPRWWCGRDGERWYAGDRTLAASLARDVAATISRDVSANEFTSSSALFQHEWQFGTYQMGALGLLQVCHEYPELRGELQPAIERAIDKLLSKEIRSFDADQWHEDALDSLNASRGHAAYLGYTNLVLALYRRWLSSPRYSDLNDRITAALMRRFNASPIHIIETYPGEAYPVDNAPGLTSVLLQHGQANETRACEAQVLDGFQNRWRDPRSHLLYQAIDGQSGRPRDVGRASGSSLAAYFLAFAERDVSHQLTSAVVGQLAGSCIGFRFVNEYSADVADGSGDIDSGPIFLGTSISGTGFSLGTSRIFAERRMFVGLSRTAYLIGTPVQRGDRQTFVTGGPLGNSIMLAMLTAQPTAP